jgi:alpha-2-macroglobulin
MTKRLPLLSLSLMLAVATQLLAASAKAPNVNLEVVQRTFAVGKSAVLSVSFYNLKQVQLAVYPIRLESLAPNAAAPSNDNPKDPASLPYLLKRLDLSRLPATRRWPEQVGRFYPDSWSEKRVKVPAALPPGVYVATVTGGGVEKRTWFAVSGRALLVKRSPTEVLAWLTNATTGQPVAGVPVAVYDARGKQAVAATTGEGLVKLPAPGLRSPAWVATQQGDPAFALAGSPDTLDPFVAFIYTDRPIYRPGHLVRFRGTLRARQGTGYGLPPAGLETIRTQIKTRGGMTVYDENLPLNGWGTFSGEFQLGPEPPLGSYEIVSTVGQGRDETVFHYSFEVEAYRKPEFTVQVSIPKSHYLGGEETVPVTFSAKYFFGSPVSAGKLTYDLTFRPLGGIPRPLLEAGKLRPGQEIIEAPIKGQARLDKDGKYTLNVKTLRLPVDRTMQVSAEVSETALRPQQSSANVPITAAAFRLSLEPDRYTYQPGERCRVKVRAFDYDSKPLSTAVKLTLTENLVDREGRAYQEKTRQTLETSSQGEATAQLDLNRLGSHELEALAEDAAGNAVYASLRLQVVKKIERRWPSLALSTDKPEYQPGDTAVITGETDQIGAWLLVTVEGEQVLSAKVYRLQSHSFTLKIPVTEACQPNVEVHGALIRKGELTAANVALNAPSKDRKLQVIITPNKERYQPAEEASYSIVTRDSRGQGVAAEVGLGVVDASLYEIRPDGTPDPFDFWWGSRGNRVVTDFSLANLYPGGAYQTMPAAAPVALRMGVSLGRAEAKDGEAPRVRKFFADTAYWGPSVVTGADGSAEAKFTVPDNLTTWRATARGLTRSTQAGEQRKDVVATLPLLVRFTLPRFYVQGDEATAAATVHNYTGGTRSVKVTLTAEGAELLQPAEQTITLPNDGIQRLTWKIRVTGPDQARFLVSADGGPGGKDAMESTLPVRPDGLQEVKAVAGMTQQSDTAILSLPADSLPGSGLVEVTLSPSLAGPIFEALQYLTDYPYGCAEQTMDSFLPDVVVANTLQRLGAQRQRPKMLDRYVSFGLQKLLRYQHDDGGWHWWEFDESDPYLSAYVCTGLKIAQDAGYVAARGPLVRGVAYLSKALGDESFRDARAYLLWALATCDVWSDAKALEPATAAAKDLFAQRSKLSLINQASLALALHHLAGARGLAAADATTFAQNAQTLAGELEGSAKAVGTGCFWGTDGRIPYSWLDSNVEVTAQALSALLTLKPDSPQVLPAVRWLMSARRGKQWTSTKDTAAAVMVLTQYLERAAELRPDFTARVYSGNKLIKEVRFAPESVWQDPVKVAIPALDLQPGDNAIRIEKTGAGNVYWAARLAHLTPGATVKPSTGLITMERRYRLPSADPVTAAEQQPADVIQVEVTLSSQENLRYALLQEPIPAGCEVLDSGEDRIADIGCDRREVWDNRLVLYFDYLPKGEVSFSYALRAEAPGTFRILPSQAELMYFPEVRGNTQPVRMKIGEAPEE